MACATVEALACSARAPSVRYGLRRLVPKEQGNVLMLTELGIDRRCGATGPASRSGGSGMAELVEVTLSGSSGLLVSTGRRVVVLRSRQRGQHDRSGTGGEEIARVRGYQRWRFREQFQREAWSRGSGR